MFRVIDRLMAHHILTTPRQAKQIHTSTYHTYTSRCVTARQLLKFFVVFSFCLWRDTISLLRIYFLSLRQVRRLEKISILSSIFFASERFYLLFAWLFFLPSFVFCTCLLLVFYLSLWLRVWLCPVSITRLFSLIDYRMWTTRPPLAIILTDIIS